MIQKLAPLKQPDYNRIFNALIQNLLPTFAKDTPQKFYNNKLETFLTCRAVAEKLRENILDTDAGNFFEEMSLNAVYKSLFANFSFADMRLLFSELPKILPLKYPAVENIRVGCMQIIPQLQNFYRSNVEAPNFLLWKNYYELENLFYMLESYGKK